MTQSIEERLKQAKQIANDAQTRRIQLETRLEALQVRKEQLSERCDAIGVRPEELEGQIKRLDEQINEGMKALEAMLPPDEKEESTGLGDEFRF